MTNANIFDVIIYKLSHRQKFGLIILFKVDKSVEISFYNVVVSICLNFSLGIKNNKKFLLNL